MKLSWHSNSGYEQMVWVLSIGIILNIDEVMIVRLCGIEGKKFLAFSLAKN